MARRVAPIHSAKLDALEELVDELAGQPLLVAYEFNEDLARLLEKFGGNTPYLGKGVGEKRTTEIVNQWNAGEIPLLLAHPASAGHGLNLQGNGASHICWFSPIWDLELYEQFIQRVHRQGTTSQRIVNHILVVRDSIDELALSALRDKTTTQDRLLASLNTEILRDADTPIAGAAASTTKEHPMTVAKLSRQADVGAAAPADRIIPRSWGRPTAAPVEAPVVQQSDAAQRERIAAQLRGAAPIRGPQDEGYRAGGQAEPEAEQDPGPSKAEQARSMFSGGVQAARAKLEGGDPLPGNIEVVKVEELPKPIEEVTTLTAPAKRTRKPAQPLTQSFDPDAPAQAPQIDYDLLGRSIVKHLFQGLAAAL